MKSLEPLSRQFQLSEGRGDWGYYLWRLIRNSAHRQAEELEFVDAKFLGFWGKVKRRLELLFRRFLGKKVESDGWHWYSKKDFNQMIRKLPEIRSVEFLKTPCDRFFCYQFDALIKKL